MANNCATNYIQHATIEESIINDSVLNRAILNQGTLNTVEILNSNLVNTMAASLQSTATSLIGITSILGNVQLSIPATIDIFNSLTNLLEPYIETIIDAYTVNKYVNRTNGILFSPTIQEDIILEANVVATLARYLEADIIHLARNYAVIKSVNDQTGLVTLTAGHVGAVSATNPVLISASIQGSTALDVTAAQSLGRQIIPEVVPEINQIIIDYFCSSESPAQAPLLDCGGQLIPIGTRIPTCEQMFQAIAGVTTGAYRDCEGVTIPYNAMIATCSDLQAAIDAIISPSYNDCEGQPIPSNAQLVTCIDLNARVPNYRDCEDQPIAADARIVTCSDLDAKLPAYKDCEGQLIPITAQLVTCADLNIRLPNYRDCEDQPIAVDARIVTCSDLDTRLPDYKDCAGYPIPSQAAIATCADLNNAIENIIIPQYMDCNEVPIINGQSIVSCENLNERLPNFKDCNNAALPSDATLVTCQNLNMRLGPIISVNASMSANIVVPPNTDSDSDGTLIIYDDIRENKGNYYDPVTGIFHPMVPGYYIIGFRNRIVNGVPAGDYLIEIIKNATKLGFDDGVANSLGSTKLLHTWVLVYMNGSSDTIKIGAYNLTGSPCEVYGNLAGINYDSFYAFLLRCDN